LLTHVRIVVLVKQIASASRRTYLLEILSNKWLSLISQSLPDKKVENLLLLSKRKCVNIPVGNLKVDSP